MDLQVDVLREALAIAGYDAVMASVVTTLAGQGVSGEQVQALGRYGEWIKGQARSVGEQAGMVIGKIAYGAWEDAGIVGVVALTAGGRAGVIDIVMAVSKGVISGEATRLADLAAADTALPEGWAD